MQKLTLDKEESREKVRRMERITLVIQLDVGLPRDTGVGGPLQTTIY